MREREADAAVHWTPRLGAHLEAFRQQANLRRIDLANQMGVSEETVRLWERGLVQPSEDSLARLIALLSLETTDWVPRKERAEDLPALAAHLWAERESRSITQAEAATWLGVAQATYAGWETGRSTPGDDESVAAVAHFLGIDAGEASELCAAPFVVDTSGWPPLGQLMGARRQALRLTRGQLAEQVGVTQHAVVAWELGTRSPGPKALQALAVALDVEASVLVAALPRRPVTTALGELIRRRQRELGLRSADVAQLAGTTEATVSRWVNGRSTPVEANLRRLADALSLPYSRVADAAGGAS